MPVVLKAFLFFILNILLKIVIIPIAPFASLFVTTRLHEQTMRMSNGLVIPSEGNTAPFVDIEMPRIFLQNWLVWLSTGDNPIDEYFWGNYHKNKYTVEEYENSSFLRWYLRVRWLWRNSFYTFRREYMGFDLYEGFKTREATKNGITLTIWENTNGTWAFRVKGDWGFRPFRTVNFGWKDIVTIKKREKKEGEPVDTLMYAGRIFSLKDGD